MVISARVALVLLAGLLLASVATAQQNAKSAPSPAQAPDSGSMADGVYRNSFFGFDYKPHFGWVDRIKEMREDSDGDSSADSNPSKKPIVLLAVFERPPEASGDTVNSGVVIAAEPAASYPGLRSAEQYFGPLTELTKSKGLNVVNEPYDLRVGTTQLVRGDFSKPMGSLTMHQSTLVMIEKGYVVSFTFIAGSEDEVDQLVEGLSFSRKETPPAQRK